MSLVDKGKLRNEFLLSFDPAGTKTDEIYPLLIISGERGVGRREEGKIKRRRGKGRKTMRGKG